MTDITILYGVTVVLGVLVGWTARILYEKGGEVMSVYGLMEEESDMRFERPRIERPKKPRRHY